MKRKQEGTSWTPRDVVLHLLSLGTVLGCVLYFYIDVCSVCLFQASLAEPYDRE